MLYQLDLTFTEEDYLASDYFFSLQSMTAKKHIRKGFLRTSAILAAFVVLVFLVSGWTTWSIAYAVFVGLYFLLHIVLYRPRVKRRLRKTLKSRCAAFPRATKMEFYEDKFVEYTPEKRIEQTYKTLEKICLINDRYVYLCECNSLVYILPISQMRAQLNQDEFLHFLYSKCSTVETYSI